MAPVEIIKDPVSDPLEILELEALSNESPIQHFYNNKGIFLTGATGFFGKIIIEKLLRVTHVAHIYILVRTKRGKDVNTRLDELFDDPVFGLLKEVNPKFRHQITIVSGDCLLPDLGISPTDRETIKQNVNIIIHGAATVRFDEKLKMALSINVNGTKEIIKLGKEILNLLAIVHVSTAFANCNHAYIEEKFYKPKISGENVSRLAECLDEGTLQNITDNLTKGFPNTYTFTKALAEDIIKNSSNGLPIAIFRPAIVITTYKEPIPGWIDNMYGPCGIIVGTSAGVMRVFYGNVVNKAYLVPVDLSVNALLSSAWDVAHNNYIEPPIYNYIPDADNPVTWKDYMEFGFNYGPQIPLSRSLWYPTLSITSSLIMFNILSFFYHIVPALLIDSVLFLIGKKTRMMKIYKKMHKFCKVMSHFSTNSWTFNNDNTRNLWLKLSKEDQKLFFFDMRSIDWNELFKVSFMGLREFIMKEDEASIPHAKKRYQRMKILHYITLSIIYVGGLYLIFLLLSSLL